MARLKVVPWLCVVCSSAIPGIRAVMTLLSDYS
jgi:hypothetical protein